jgi:branched-chain amino acid transport system permease protein
MVLFALSLDLALGYAGIITLGHAAFFGAGAYTVGMLAHHGIWNEPISGLIMAAAVAARSSASCRAWCCCAPPASPSDADAVHHAAAGGAANLGRMDRRLRRAAESADPAAVRLFEFNPLFPRTQYLYVLASCSSASCSCACSCYSPFGQSLTGIRENTLRMHAVGAPVRTRLVVCYTISAAIAGVAGGAVGAGQRLREPDHARSTARPRC